MATYLDVLELRLAEVPYIGIRRYRFKVAAHDLRELLLDQLVEVAGPRGARLVGRQCGERHFDRLSDGLGQ